MLETSDKTYIKNGTLRVVDEVVRGHEKWEDSNAVKEYGGRFDVSDVVDISAGYEYYCANGDRLCAWVSLCSEPDKEIQKAYCDSNIKVKAYEISSPDAKTVTKYYFRGILQTDVDNDNLMTPIRRSYDNIFNRISAYSYNTKDVGHRENGKFMLGPGIGAKSTKNYLKTI